LLKLQVPYIYPLNLGQLIRHLTLSYLLYIYITAYITAKGIISKTETRAIKTSPLQCLILYLSPVHIIQGHCLIFTLLGQLSCTSLIIALENQTRPNLDNIRCIYAVNFTQFYKQKDIKVIKIYIAELVKLVK
jgi:hypothetical protein